MGKPALQLLGHGVDVAEAALQRMVLEDRGGAGGVVGEVDGLACLVDGVGRGTADDDAEADAAGPGCPAYESRSLLRDGGI